MSSWAVIPALRRLRWKNCKFKASLGYLSRKILSQKEIYVKPCKLRTICNSLSLS
jgi:hypothetical protein